MSPKPKSRIGRALLALLTLLLGRRRRKPEAERPSPEERLRRAEEQIDEHAPVERQAEELEKLHERIGEESERAAEPPLALELRAGPDRRAENVVIVALLAATLGAAGFIVFYLAFPDTQLLGLCLGAALAALAVAAVVAGKKVLPQEKAVEEYHYYGDEEEQQRVEATVKEAGEGVSRRRLLTGAAGAAGVTLGAAVLFPAASLGPSIGERVYQTPWRRGRRVVDADDHAIAAEDITEGTFVSGFPEGASKEDFGSPLIIVRLPERELQLRPERRAGAPEGILAFSKICPHAGCAISIYRHPLYDPVEPRPALVCPCHYSTFDPRRGGRLLFGPAGRDLPQLPLRINARRELEAAGEFYDAIGPSYGGSRLKPRGLQ